MKGNPPTSDEQTGSLIITMMTIKRRSGNFDPVEAKAYPGSGELYEDTIQGLSEPLDVCEY